MIRALLGALVALALFLGLSGTSHAAPATYAVSGTEGAGLRLRSQPGTWSRVLDVLPEGTVVELGDERVAASGHTWAPARGGWLALTYLAPVDEATAPAGEETPAPPEEEADNGPVVDLALRYTGVPYVWGASSPAGWDCSGFTSYIYRRFGVVLPRASYAQIGVGRPVRRAELAPGDLVFFDTWGASPGHVGIYIGRGRMVNALNEWAGTVVTDITTPYWTTRYVGARRVR